MTTRRLKKHRVILTLILEESVTPAAAHDYVVDAVGSMHGARSFRYAPDNPDDHEEDSVLCGEVLSVSTSRTAWSKS